MLRRKNWRCARLSAIRLNMLSVLIETRNDEEALARTLGSLIGGVMAYFTYAFVVVSAPMLLDPKANIGAATVSSFKAVTDNPLPMALWAAIIGLFVFIAAASGFLLLTVIFPWLGLASWRAYRDLVPQGAE